MYMPNFLDGFDRFVAFDAETTGKRTPDAEFIRKQPFAWKAPGIIIEVGFVEMLREGEGWRKGETWSSRVNPDGPIDPEAIKIHRIRPADLKNAPRFPASCAGPARRQIMTILVKPNEARGAALDEAHVGHIHGAFGTILHGDVAPRETWKHRLITLMAILGPGLIVMVGDNDAGAFATYGQAGQNYGTTLLWTLALPDSGPLRQSRNGVAPRRGHRRRPRAAHLRAVRQVLGRISVIDLFMLNALTIVTEFIGISLALDYLGLDKTTGVIVSAALVMLAVSTGDFRRFERFAMVLVGASLLLIPIYFMAHPPFAQVARDFLVPHMPEGGKLSDVMLLIIGLVGTTVAPWQLFFQQSYVVDKRITPRFMSAIERLDLWIGITLVIIGAPLSWPSLRPPSPASRNSTISPTRAESPPASANMSARPPGPEFRSEAQRA